MPWLIQTGLAKSLHFDTNQEGRMWVEKSEEYT